MVNETSDRPRLTPKGARTRARIVEEAAALIHERGVAGTTLEDVRVAAEVSGSQLYHYFADKSELVQAVIDYQADAIVNRNRHALGSANGVEAWRKMVITAAKRTKAKGGCALGSLVGQLAESDPEARALILVKFGPQSVAAVYLKEFYGYASTVASGRAQLDGVHSLAGKMAAGIYLRNVTRAMAEKFVREAQAEKRMFYLNDENKQKELNTLRDAIDTLQRELVAIDVFIDTIKANPKALR